MLPKEIVEKINEIVEFSHKILNCRSSFSTGYWIYCNPNKLDIVGLTRIELVTSTLSLIIDSNYIQPIIISEQFYTVYSVKSVWRSNQLSYKPIIVLMGGLEPPTSILSGLPSKPTDIHQDESF